MMDVVRRMLYQSKADQAYCIFPMCIRMSACIVRASVRAMIRSHGCVLYFFSGCFLSASVRFCLQRFYCGSLCVLHISPTVILLVLVGWLVGFVCYWLLVFYFSFIFFSYFVSYPIVCNAMPCHAKMQLPPARKNKNQLALHVLVNPGIRNGRYHGRASWASEVTECTFGSGALALCSSCLFGRFSP